ncbi:hypothetical protein ABO04_01690 [Nitrosomonas sp. HPC101]|nr:hypothetical protein [Nitrosomonas sp. HPC101]
MYFADGMQNQCAKDAGKLCARYVVLFAIITILLAMRFMEGLIRGFLYRTAYQNERGCFASYPRIRNSKLMAVFFVAVGRESNKPFVF